ncbi:hypothetical protein GBAR_LOCUS28412 [Geodia barretti]|uniref:Uncharacterized protein n=1 Tax=Geodia barretti TaxID=519541 RepID=A0AA35TPA8_GEOBA|nr:hypothetical protein GBAR_LOCUS28412 [Geodia barretti]
MVQPIWMKCRWCIQSLVRITKSCFLSKKTFHNNQLCHSKQSPAICHSQQPLKKFIHILRPFLKAIELQMSRRKQTGGKKEESTIPKHQLLSYPLAQ